MLTLQEAISHRRRLRENGAKERAHKQGRADGQCTLRAVRPGWLGRLLFGQRKADHYRMRRNVLKALCVYPTTRPFTGK